MYNNNELLYPITGGIYMIKKLVAGSVMLIMLGTSSTLAYANPIDNTNNKNDTIKQKTEKADQVKPVFEVVYPEENLTINEKDKDLVLSFKAPEGSKVSIEVYNNISKDKNYKEYELSYEPIEITIGSFQRAWAEIELSKGFNKIVFQAKHKNGMKDRQIRVINVMETQEIKQILEDIVTKSSLGSSRKP